MNNNISSGQGLQTIDVQFDLFGSIVRVMSVNDKILVIAIASKSNATQNNCVRSIPAVKTTSVISSPTLPLVIVPNSPIDKGQTTFAFGGCAPEEI